MLMAECCMCNYWAIKIVPQMANEHTWKNDAAHCVLLTLKKNKIAVQKQKINPWINVQWTIAYPATTGPDHGQISEIAGFVNHHANRVYNISALPISTAVSFLVMLSIIDANNHRIFASSGLQRSKFRYLWVFQRSSTATLLRMQHGH